MTRIWELFLALLFYKVFNSFCFAECVFDNPNFPLVLQSFGNDKLILPNLSTDLFNNNRQITLICPNGFEFNPDYYGNREYNPISVLTIRCQDNNLFGDVAGIPYNRYLQCKRGPWKTSEVASSTCPKNSSYVVGFEIDHFKVIFAEICFNAKNLTLDYVHFVAGQRTPLLSRHVEMNPLSITESLNDNFDALLEPYFMTSAELGVYIDNTFNSSAIKFNYEFKELVPSWIFQSYYDNALSSFYIQNNAIFWNQLRGGNWKKFEDDLQARSEAHEYDVYMGTSHIAPGPPSNSICDDDMKTLTYSGYHQFTQSIPKFIWAYLKQRGDNRSDSEQFVVIAVNTPFFERLTPNNEIFCEDICDQIHWLKSLKSTRKMPELGYTFCCAFNQKLIQQIDGFPRQYLEKDGNLAETGAHLANYDYDVGANTVEPPSEETAEYE